jgi:hypothetical protein
MKKKSMNSDADQAMKSDSPVEQKEQVAPRTPAEELITEIYASILNVEPFGVYDNLTTLTMPQAAQLKHYLQQIFNVDIPADRLTLYSTVNSLVDFLSDVWGGREIVEEIAWTSLQVEKLSDDEVRSHLAISMDTSDKN